MDQNFLHMRPNIGFILFLGVSVSMFFTMRSPLRLYHDKPDVSIVFQFLCPEKFESHLLLSTISTYRTNPDMACRNFPIDESAIG